MLSKVVGRGVTMKTNAVLRMMLPMISILAAASCIIAIVDQEGRSAYRPDRTFNRTMAFEPGGTVALNHDSGIVEITGWENDEVEVTAEKVRAEERSTGVRVSALRHERTPSIHLDRDGDFLRISRRESWRDEDDDELDFRLRVPRPITLDPIALRNGEIWISDLFGRAVLDLEAGKVDIQNYSGSLDIAVGRGSVRAEILDLRAEDDIAIRVEMGDIVLFLQPGVRAEIRAETPGGLISGEFDLGEDLPSSEIAARLGDENGAAKIFLSTNRGNIRVLKTKDPDPDGFPTH